MSNWGKNVFVEVAKFPLDFSCTYNYNKYVHGKCGDKMTPRTGRPKSDNPKNVQIKFLADKQMVEDLNFCCQALQATKSDVIRMGIQKVKDEVKK